MSRVSLFLFGYSAVCLLRTHLVARAYYRAIDTASDLASQDIDLGLPWRWRYEVIDASMPQFFAHVFLLWRRVDPFRDSPALRTEP